MVGGGAREDGGMEGSPDGTPGGPWVSGPRSSGRSGRSIAPRGPMRAPTRPMRSSPLALVALALAACSSDPDPGGAPADGAVDVPIVDGGSVIDAALKATLREVFARGQTAGLRANVFAKLGDGITSSESFLADFGPTAGPSFNLGAHAALDPTRVFFGATLVTDRHSSFDRESVAALTRVDHRGRPHRRRHDHPPGDRRAAPGHRDRDARQRRRRGDRARRLPQQPHAHRPAPPRGRHHHRC